MISAALQTTLAGIITNTYFIMGDEGIITPYCVHKESAVPERLKVGVSGYMNDCEIVIIDDTPDKVQALVQSVITAIEALEKTTVSGTTFQQVNFEGDDPQYDDEAKMYVNVLRFTIETSNR